MSAIRNFVTAAALAAGASVLATAALASTSHLTDAQYIAAAHCQGLFDSHSLGPVDASGFDKMMRNEGAFRLPAVLDRADEARNSALSAASRAHGLQRTALVTERDDACSVWASNPMVANVR